MYVRKTVYMKNIIERCNYFTGRLGKKINNGAVKGKTPENQLRYQDRKAARILYYKLNMNFSGGDLFMTLTYPPHTPISSQQARHDIKNFLDTLRRIYKRSNMTLKYAYVSGKSKRGMVHFHIVLNKYDTQIITGVWHNIVGTFEVPYPRVNIRHLDNSGDYMKLASYMIKNSCETFYSDDPIHKKRFCASLNLEMPHIEKEIIDAKEWRKAPKPIKGYVIDKNSIYDGYGWSDEGSLFASCRIQRYKMIKYDHTLKEKRWRKKTSPPDIPEIVEPWNLEPE